MFMSQRSALRLMLPLLLVALLFCAAPAAATGDDYEMWVQSEARHFFPGAFTNTCADPEIPAVTLERAAHGGTYPAEGEYLSPEYRADRPFDALFLSYRAACAGKDALRLFVRVADETKRYSDWVEMASETDRVFAAEHRYFQYKALFASADGRTTPTLSSVAVSFADLYEEMKELSAEPVDYNALAAAPEIIEREAWGAVKPSGGYAEQTPEAIILHHSWLPSAAQYTGAATIRGIQNYHMTGATTGWIDIGYHFLIGPDGKIYRGRPETAVGSHCVPNSNKIGICCIGDHDPGKDPLTPASYAALKKLVPYLATKYRISRTQLYGHRDFSPKTCPGETVYVKIPELKTFMLKLLGK